MIRKTFLILLLSLSGLLLFAQEKDTNAVVQFSGIVYADSVNPLPITHVIILNKGKGTITDFKGYFSFAAQENDTIYFSYLGYKSQKVIIPDTLQDLDFFVNIFMEKDTILMQELTVYPYGTFDQFKQAFLALDIPDDDVERAKKNFKLIGIQEKSFDDMPDAMSSYKKFQNDTYLSTSSQG